MIIHQFSDVPLVQYLRDGGRTSRLAKNVPPPLLLQYKCIALAYAVTYACNV